MRTRALVFTLFLALPALSSAALPDTSIATALDRFEGAQAQSLVEDVWAHQRRLVGRRFSGAHNGRASDEDALIRVEWYLRLGALRSPLTLEDLNGVRDPQLLDEVLWSLLNEAVMGDLFLPSNDWSAIRRSLADFLESHPLRKAMLETPRATWWAWIQDLPLKKEKPWELEVLAELLEARTMGDPLKRLQRSCRASSVLPEDARVVGLSIAREVRAAFPEETLRQRQLLREIFVRKVSCERLYFDLAEVYEQRQLFEIASEQRSHALLQKLEAGDILSASELRDVARSSFEAKDWRKAFEFYSRALEAGSSDLDVRVRLLVAGTRARAPGYEDPERTQTNFENMLQQAFQSLHRDELLQSYATYLESQKRDEAALEVWRWNYEYATSKSQRLEGLEKSSRLAGLRLDKGLTGLERKNEAIKWLDALSTLHRLNPTSELLRRERSLAEPRLRRLNLFSEADVRASLEELRKDARP